MSYCSLDYLLKINIRNVMIKNSWESKLLTNITTIQSQLPIFPNYLSWYIAQKNNQTVRQLNCEPTDMTSGAQPASAWIQWWFAARTPSMSTTVSQSRSRSTMACSSPPLAHLVGHGFVDLLSEPEEALSLDCDGASHCRSRRHRFLLFARGRV